MEKILVCPKCNVVHDDPCPDCGRKLFRGFGLAGGGYGPWATCECGYFMKEQEPLEGAPDGR